jgi:AcrR family transcriptional regulator
MKKVLIEDEQRRSGLRERKKAKTRAAIQQQALRLFHEQGYAATTVEQIAAAVEVSPSTFFRYFPTKEDVVLYDDLDPLFFAAFQAQPPELTPIQAMRGALHLVFAGLSGEQMEQQQVRTELILAVPELRMRMLDQFANLVDLLAELVGKRVGRSANDSRVRAFSGALMGTLLAPILADQQGSLRDFIAQMEDSLDFLEAGLPL